MHELSKLDLIHKEAKSVTGQTMGENLLMLLSPVLMLFTALRILIAKQAALLYSKAISPPTAA